MGAAVDLATRQCYIALSLEHAAQASNIRINKRKLWNVLFVQ